MKIKLLKVDLIFDCFKQVISIMLNYFSHLKSFINTNISFEKDNLQL